jgi:transmembrane sensor
MRVRLGKLQSLHKRRQCHRWLCRTPENVRELLALEMIHAALARGGLEATARDAEPRSNVIPFPKKPRARPSAEGAASSWPVRIAASLSSFGIVLLLGWMAKSAVVDRTVATLASEWHLQALVDGSKVLLGPRTRLHVEFGDDQRLVRLFGGEALFVVAPDARRPFLVDAGTAVVRAIGTRFGITRDGHEVTVTVAEGSVAVMSSSRRAVASKRAVGTAGHASGGAREPETGGGGGLGVVVAANQQASVSREEPVEVKSVNAEHELAWARKQLIFDGDTIEEAVQAFNRRNWIQIKVVDWEIAARRVHGVFNADDPDAFIDVLQSDPAIVVKQERPDLLRVERQEPMDDSN